MESIIILCNQAERGHIAEGWNWGECTQGQQQGQPCLLAFPTIAARVLPKWPSRLKRTEEEEESLKIQVILSRDPLPCARRLLVKVY